jgi:FkbM family methyltransferase
MITPEFTSEDQRYEHDLNTESVVMDLGGYHGDWSARMADTYGCRIFCFEPIRENCRKILERAIPRLTLFQCAVGAHTNLLSFGLSNDSTGVFARTGPQEQIWCVALDFLTRLLPSRIDLLKINVEGMEYELLPGIAALKVFKEIQVQFHGNVPNAGARRDAIREELSRDFECTYCTPFVWENWKLR